MTYDGKEATFENLCKHFFSFHDPTTMDSQGNDRGTQYASAIFCYDQKQKEIATKGRGFPTLGFAAMS
jgi:peptide-methionine (S)-S-oxide reductase